MMIESIQMLKRTISALNAAIRVGLGFGMKKDLGKQTGSIVYWIGRIIGSTLKNQTSRYLHRQSKMAEFLFLGPS